MDGFRVEGPTGMTQMAGSRLLGKLGRRISYGGSSSASGLFVLTVRERCEPYLHYLISAYEVGQTLEWDLLIDSGDVWRCVASTQEEQYHDPARRRILAMELMRSA